MTNFMGAFQGVDIILGPVTPTPPFKLGEKLEDPLEMYLSDVFTVSANLAGLPGLSLPGRVYPDRSADRSAIASPAFC